MEEPFSHISPGIRQIVVALQQLIREVFPNAVETADRDGLGFGFDKGYRGLVFTVMPYRDHVNLGFARGVELPDPAGLLEGTGKVHRHVKIRTLEDARRPELVALAGVALEVAIRRRARSR